jgi:tetratricopeptide (TPR) repeat protein
VHTAAGRHEQAARAFEQAYELGPSAEHAVALGLAQQQLGRPEAAAELLAARLATHPDETAVRFQLAQALMATGDHPGAIREYEDSGADTARKRGGAEQPRLPVPGRGR